MTNQTDIVRLYTFAGAIILPLLLYIGLAGKSDAFWDLKIYEFAIENYLAGTNPYLNNKGLRFVYPPVFIKIFSLLHPLLYDIFITFYVATFSLLLHSKMRPLALGILLCTGLLHQQFWRATLTGNITIYLHLIVIFLWLSERKGKIFYITLFIISCMKPYFLAYLILPFINHGLNRQLVRSTTYLLSAVTICFALQWVLLPLEFAAFSNALMEQAGTHLGNFDDMDLGESLFSITLRLSHDEWLAMGIHVTVIACLVAYNMLICKPAHSHIPDIIRFTWMPILIAGMANPRVKVYDSAIFTAIAAAIIIGLSDRSRHPWLLIVLLTANALMFASLLGFDTQNCYQIKRYLFLFDNYFIVVLALWMISRVANRIGPPQPNHKTPFAL